VSFHIPYPLTADGIRLTSHNGLEEEVRNGKLEVFFVFIDPTTEHHVVALVL
jgi:hypothetical protein